MNAQSWPLRAQNDPKVTKNSQKQPKKGIFWFLQNEKTNRQFIQFGCHLHVAGPQGILAVFDRFWSLLGHFARLGANFERS